jgi:hypothetical protein
MRILHALCAALGLVGHAVASTPPPDITEFLWIGYQYVTQSRVDSYLPDSKVFYMMRLRPNRRASKDQAPGPSMASDNPAAAKTTNDNSNRCPKIMTKI